MFVICHLLSSILYDNKQNKFNNILNIYKSGNSYLHRYFTLTVILDEHTWVCNNCVGCSNLSFPTGQVCPVLARGRVHVLWRHHRVDGQCRTVFRLHHSNVHHFQGSISESFEIIIWVYKLFRSVLSTTLV